MATRRKPRKRRARRSRKRGGKPLQETISSVKGFFSKNLFGSTKNKESQEVKAEPQPAQPPLPPPKATQPQSAPKPAAPPAVRIITPINEPAKARRPAPSSPPEPTAPSTLPVFEMPTFGPNDHVMKVGAKIFHFVGRMKAGKKKLSFGVFDAPYATVLVDSYKDNKIYARLHFYASNSEVGMWRLACIYKDYSSYKFHKTAYDYIQATLMHLKLQKYIAEHALPELDVQQSFDNGLFFVEPRSSSDIPDGERMLLPTSLLKVANSSDERVLVTLRPDLLDKVVRDSVVRAEPFSDDFFRRYYPFVDYVECGKTTESGLYRYYEVINHVLIQNFSCDLMENVIIPQYSYKFFDYDVEGAVCSVNLREKPKRGNTYLNGSPLNCTIHYLKCHIKHLPGDKEGKKVHYMPILLTKDVTEVRNNPTATGLNDNFIVAGAYICKLFEYKMLCHRNEEGAIDCTEMYNYVGGRYSHVFPFEQLAEKDKAPPALLPLSLPAPTPTPTATPTSEEAAVVEEPSAVELDRATEVAASSGGRRKRGSRKRQTRR